jgi:GNAT superfamily N-acetyltransferase
MTEIKFLNYSEKDNNDALLLEDQCPQGRNLVLKFRRPTFHARSQVYDNYKILCAKSGSKLVGIIGGTIKNVRLHGEEIQAAYVYDLRVHPEFQRKGIGKRLTNALLEELGQVDCIYTLIAGGNDKALHLAIRNFEMKVVVPFTCLIIPVYKRTEAKETHQAKTASELHDLFLNQNPDLEFLPDFENERLKGFISSIALNNSGEAGCSIWTNENLLAEQVVRITSYLKLMKLFTALLRPFINLPIIPQPGEILRSWFLFDFFGTDKVSIRNLLDVVNNLALANNKTFLYILLQSNSSILQLVRKTGLKMFSFPYAFLANGTKFPFEMDNIYIDVRDL